MRTRFLGLLLSLVIPFIACGGTEHVESTACDELKDMDLSTISDAPTQIKGAMFVQAGNKLPAHCEVKGYVSTNVGVGLLLPTERWNGKLIQVGCGGFCGFIPTDTGACSDALARGYACIASDQGTRSAGGDAKWAYNNFQSEIDYGYRSAHVAAVVGKAIVDRYYGSAPKHSYFIGCSGGGRQGIVEAQHFPLDFDGIVAMEPSLNLSSIVMTALWNSRAVRDQDGNPLFAQKDADTLHRAIVKKCDMNDGIYDGLIGDPRLCDFDAVETLCKEGAQAGCLTSAQVAAARKVYIGPMTSTGIPITGRGAMLGSEVDGTWGISSHLAGARNEGVLRFATEFFRYMAFVPDPGPHWQAEDFDFDRDFDRLRMMDWIYAATNPDLRQFKAKGGKLILIQGLHDSGAPNPHGSIDYYETVQNTMGGPAPTLDFFRLFLVPGRSHCGGGAGSWAIDHLTYLEKWVEQGVAPDSMIASHVTEAFVDSQTARHPLPPSAVKSTRPVYPYPALAYYKGTGSPNDAANFEPRARKVQTQVH